MNKYKEIQINIQVSPEYILKELLKNSIQITASSEICSKEENK
jgi:hypothetical protein